MMERALADEETEATSCRPPRFRGREQARPRARDAAARFARTRGDLARPPGRAARHSARPLGSTLRAHGPLLTCRRRHAREMLLTARAPTPSTRSTPAPAAAPMDPPASMRALFFRGGVGPCHFALVSTRARARPAPTAQHAGRWRRFCFSFLLYDLFTLFTNSPLRRSRSSEGRSHRQRRSTLRHHTGSHTLSRISRLTHSGSHGASCVD